MTYAEKLKDPRWQKKRLEIMERDGWMCQICQDTKETLHVHHVRYTEDDPWNEPVENLYTVCDCCHQGLHSIIKALSEVERVMNVLGSWAILEPSPFWEIIEKTTRFTAHELWWIFEEKRLACEDWILAHQEEVK